jgi:single-strand DNA-binding protein
MNVAVLVGALSSAPELRTLASGDVLAQLQITTRTDGTTRSVPVSLFDPPDWLRALEPGDEVVVLGSVHRRFFRAGAVTASRTEVVADRVQRARDRRGRERLLRAAHGALDSLGE